MIEAEAKVKQLLKNNANLKLLHTKVETWLRRQKNKSLTSKVKLMWLSASVIGYQTSFKQ